MRHPVPKATEQAWTSESPTEIGTKAEMAR
jgi:hypothetical protein